MKKVHLILAFLGVLGVGGEAWGRPVIMVNEVKGNVFAVSENRTWPLKKGEYLEDFVEILTEEGASAIFDDLFGHTFRLAGSGHVKMINKILELKRGYLWVQSSPGRQEEFVIHTANAKADGRDSDFIISFDNATGKSQLLVTRGFTNFGNIIRPESPLTVTTGSFSFIDKDFENGVPRNPTPLGYTSFKNIMALFGEKTKDDFSLVVKEKETEKGSRGGQGRSIASMEEEPKQKQTTAEEKKARPEITPGKIIILKADHGKEKIKKVSFNLNHFLSQNIHEVKKEKEKKEKIRAMTQHSQVRIKIFGAGLRSRPLPLLPKPISHLHSPPTPPTKLAPVAIHPTPAVLENEKDKLANELEQKMQLLNQNLRGAGREPASVNERPENGNLGHEFESALKNAEKKQLRHPGEINQLIKDLESFDKDYEEKY